MGSLSHLTKCHQMYLFYLLYLKNLMLRRNSPSAKPPAGRYVRVEHNKMWKKKQKTKNKKKTTLPLCLIWSSYDKAFCVCIVLAASGAYTWSNNDLVRLSLGTHLDPFSVCSCLHRYYPRDWTHTLLAPSIWSTIIIDLCSAYVSNSYNISHFACLVFWSSLLITTKTQVILLERHA